MGKLLNENEIIEKHITRYTERAASEYTKWLETKPNFVTFYHRYQLGSTYDKGLENVEGVIGLNSPNKYDKIEKFPIWGLNELSYDLSKEDTGMSTSYEGEAIIIPNTISPLPDDFFTINYIGKVYIFKIINVVNDAIKSKPFYKIEFNFYKVLSDEDEILEQVNETYTAIYKNIGTHDKYIVKSSDYFTLDTVSKIYERLARDFIKFFYDKKLNIITTNFSGKRFFSRHLHKFIMDNDLFKWDYSFMDTIFFSEVLEEDIQLYQLYKNTIYYSMEHQTPDSIIGKYAYLTTIGIENTPFVRYNYTYYHINFVEQWDKNCIKLFPKGFIDRIKINQIYRDEDRFLENAIIEYINNNFKMTDEFIEKLTDLHLEPNEYCFTMIPLILFILKKYKEAITYKMV